MSNRRAQDERIEGTPDGSNAITEIVDIPDTPTNVVATAGEENSSVTFTPATTGGTASLFTATSNPGSITGTSATSPITVNGLTAGTSYTFSVRGSNSTGTGPYSSESNSITPTQPLVGAYDALATVTLSESASSIIFAGIPSGYEHLQLRWTAKTDRAETDDVVLITFNSDTAANYSWHYLRGNGTAVTSSATANASNIAINYGATGNSSATDIFAGSIMDILDYQNTEKYKTIRTLNGVDFNTTNGYIYLSSGNWRSNNAITSITLDQQYGSNFRQYSQFTLFGVK